MTFVAGGPSYWETPMLSFGQGMVCSTFWPRRVWMEQRRRWNCIVIASEMVKIPLRKPFSRSGDVIVKDNVLQRYGSLWTIFARSCARVTLVWLWLVMMKFLRQHIKYVHFNRRCSVLVWWGLLGLIIQQSRPPILTRLPEFLVLPWSFWTPSTPDQQVFSHHER